MLLQKLKKEQEITKLKKKIFFHFVVCETFPVEENEAIMKGCHSSNPVICCFIWEQPIPISSKTNKPTDKQNPTLSDDSLHTLIPLLEKKAKVTILH